MTYKRASFGLMGGLTGLLCFFAILLSTSWGAQLSFYIVKTFAPIEAKYESGALLNDLRLSQLTIKNENALIEVKDLRLQLHLRCFWKNQLCIDELSIASLQLTMHKDNSADNETVVEQPNAPVSFTLPFSVKMKKFYLGKAQINSEKMAIKLANFSSALSVSISATKQMTITIENSMLANAHIVLLKSEAAKVKPVVANTAWPLATLPEIYLPFKLSLKSLIVKALTVTEQSKTGTENSLLSISDAFTRLSWHKTQLSIEKLSSTIGTVGEFALKGKLNFVPPYGVDLTLNSAVSDLALLPQLNNTNQQLLLQGDLSQLVAKVSSEGELALTANMSIDATNENLPYKLSADVTKFTLPDDIADVVTPSTLSLQSEGDLNHQNIALQSNISGFGYQNALLELNADYVDQHFQINTLYFEEPNANNKLNLKGKLQLGDKISWNLTLNSNGLTLPTIDQRLSGRIQGDIKSEGFWQNNEWSVKLINSELTGEINQITLNAKANIDVNHTGKLAPSEVVLHYGDIALNIEGYSDENWHVQGHTNIKSISSLLAQVQGGLNASFEISGPVLHPEVSLQGSVDNILFDQLASDKVNFNVQYSPLNNHQHNITFTSAAINWGDHFINDFNLGSRGNYNQQNINLAWLGDSSVDLVFDSEYSPTNEQVKIDTQTLSLALAKQAFKPDQPINLIYNNSQKTLALNKHCWLGTGAQLCLNQNVHLNLGKDKLALAITANTDLLTPFIPNDMRLESSLEGDVFIGWQQNSMPTIDAGFIINKGHVQVDKEDGLHTLLAWQQGKLNIKLNNSSFLSNVNLLTLDSREILSANTTLSLEDYRFVDTNVTINDFNLSPLQVFTPELSSLEGLLNTQLNIAGELTDPLINGEVKLTKGKTKILGNINNVDEINLAVTFNGKEAIVSGGLNLNNKTASLTGSANWKDELEGQFNFDGESLHFSVPPDVTLTVSPHLIAQINASALKLTGRIEVLDGHLSINKLPQGSVSLSKDVIIVNDKGEQVAKEKPFEILTNIRVLIAEAFKVEGQGFVGRIGGELQISQQPQQPVQLFGSLKIPEGRYRAYGQDLSMTKGNIAFNGPVNNPYVSIQATRSIEKENIVVGIEATGLANSLNIKLFSKPTMQQSETLSYLVRGRGLDAETSDSNTAIGVALGTAITNYSGLLTQIEKLPLINRIEIDGDDKQASIAGYIGEQVYIKYGIGIMEPINELTVRFYLLNRLWVETVSGLENSADIYYSFDIK